MKTQLDARIIKVVWLDEPARTTHKPVIGAKTDAATVTSIIVVFMAVRIRHKELSEVQIELDRFFGCAKCVKRELVA